MPDTSEIGAIEEAIRQARTGNQELLAAVLNGKRSQLERACVRLGVTPDDAEDIVCVAVINALKDIDSLQTEAKLVSWVYRITINLCISSLRKIKSTGGRQVSLGDLAEPQAVTSRPDERILADASVNEMLEPLNECERQVAVLLYSGWKPKEISKMMGLSETRIRQIRINIRKKLRKPRAWWLWCIITLW